MSTLHDLYILNRFPLVPDLCRHCKDGGLHLHPLLFLCTWSRLLNAEDSGSMRLRLLGKAQASTIKMKHFGYS